LFGGGTATIVGVIGHDQNGAQLLSELQRAGIQATGVVVDAARPTTTKTRVVTESSLRFPQQLARIDHLDRSPMSRSVEAELVTRAQQLIPAVDAVLVSDYQTGVASQTLVQAILESARVHGKLCTVDAQGSFDRYKGFDLIKGNRQEIEAAVGRSLLEEAGYRRVGESLLRDLDVGAVLITRGAEGMSCISRNEGYVHLPAANRTEVFDVTGAGDTVIAVATLALLAGANAFDAARMANHAAGLVVRKLGNAVVTADELVQAIQFG
jgi:rfaE bifunctional protein kinase chain/domain